MLTIFTIPKPFVGHIGVIQRNAVRSWLALRPECEIILLGDEEGVAACAREHDVRHLPDIACNDYGTPLLDDAFEQVKHTSRFPCLCYVNADIILPPGFTRCIERVRLSDFLMVGQRVTVDVRDELDFSNPSCTGALAEQIRSTGVQDAPYGSDYFVFPKGAMGRLPPFAVGRPYWDNWMIYRARELRVPVVDASECVLVVHQEHAYTHVPQRSGSRWEGPEAENNRTMVSPTAQRFTVRHASWRLTPRGLAKRQWWTPRDRDDVFSAMEAFHPWIRPIHRAVGLLERRWDRRLVRWIRMHARPHNGQ